VINLPKKLIDEAFDENICQEFNEKSRPTFKNNTLPLFKNWLF